MNTVKIPYIYEFHIYKYADCDYRKKLIAFIHVGGGCTNRSRNRIEYWKLSLTFDDPQLLSRMENQNRPLNKTELKYS